MDPRIPRPLRVSGVRSGAVVEADQLQQTLARGETVASTADDSWVSCTSDR